MKGSCILRTTPFDSNFCDGDYARVCTPEQDGYFSSIDNLSPQCLGDVNGNGTVSIADVSDLIDYILSRDASGINAANADCDRNGSISIGDISALIDYILNGTWSD